MNEQELQLLTQQLADIAMPPAPDWQPAIIVATLLIVFIFTTVLMLYLKKNSSQPITDNADNTQTKLDALQNSWTKGETTDHDAAYQIAMLLRQGLKLKQLGATPPSSLIAHENHWRNAIKQLQTLRYKKTDGRLDKDIFDNAKHWLNSERSAC